MDVVSLVRVGVMYSVFDCTCEFASSDVVQSKDPVLHVGLDSLLGEARVYCKPKAICLDLVVPDTRIESVKIIIHDHAILFSCQFQPGGLRGWNPIHHDG